ncbi:MAG: hypothetical protein E6J20_11200 [Chloroflexi bacterium]|nr:MAG: hypothetical protein E6J20_11200 [Chloroflexota bacterium]
MIDQLVGQEHSTAKDAVAGLDATKAIDGLVIALIALISTIPYVGRIGFYSDDWSFLGALAVGNDHSFGTLFMATIRQVATRPVQAAYLSGLYELFGANPLAFQLVAAGALAIGGILAYLALRRFAFNRVEALVTAAIFVTLPSYSADRFWLSAAQALVSMCFFFASAYALGRAGSPATANWRSWLGLSATALLLSALAYEVFLPLFVVAALALPIAVDVPAQRRWAIRIINPALVVLLGVTKAVFTTRLGGGGVSGQLSWLVHLVEGALKINGWDFGLALPLNSVRMFAHHPSLVAAIAGASAGALIYAWVVGSARTVSTGRRLAVAGIVTFAGGYAIFLTNNNALMTPTGSGNRVNIAAAFGMALVITGAAIWVAGRFRRPTLSAQVLGVVAAGVVGFGVMTNVVLATYWEQASTTQSAVLAALKNDVPSLPANATLIIDGVCPYVGPGVVFETTWDVTGALRMEYRSASLTGDVATNRMWVASDGLHSFTYQTETIHPYSDLLLVYDYRTHGVVELTSETAALAYFAAHPASACPAGSPGYGSGVM